MTPIYQTKFSENGEHGNCFAACLSSMFNIPIDAIPPFEDCGDQWWPKFVKWLSGKGLYPICFQHDYCPEGLCFVMGVSPRNPEINHQVIYRNGEMVHDPHPSNAGVTTIKEVMIFVPYEPEIKVGKDDHER